jgi:hypothetical protein
MAFEITNVRAEWRLGSLELVLGWLFAASGVACYGMWYTGVRGEHHGEIAFLWLYAAFGFPLGLAFLIAGQALRRSWKRRWVFQLLVPLWIAAAWALFDYFLLPG